MDLRHELKHRITPSDALAIKSRLSQGTPPKKPDGEGDNSGFTPPNTGRNSDKKEPAENNGQNQNPDSEEKPGNT